MSKNRQNKGKKKEIRFTISVQTENLVKEICSSMGLRETELGKIALVEYIREFSFNGRN